MHRDAADDRSLVRSVKDAEFQQFFGLFDLLARLDLADADVARAEIVNADLRHICQLLADFFSLGVNAVVVLDDAVELLDLLLNVDTREERFALLHRHVLGQDAELVGVFVARAALARADLSKRLRHGRRHERGKQRRHDADGVEQVIEHRRQSCTLRLIFREDPRSCFVDILVRAGNDLEDFRQRVLQLGLVHEDVDLRSQRGRLGNQVVVKLACFTLGGKCAAEVFFHHRDGAGNEVAQTVRKVGVDAVDHDLVRERAVRAERHLAHDVVADRVRAVALAEDERVDDVAEGLGHLLTVEGDPAVYSEVLWQRKLERHQHRRPDDRVEAHDILRDHVGVGRPELVEVVVLVIEIAQRGDIVGERVDPDIDDMLLVEGHGDAPLEGRARYAQIFQTGLDEVVDQLGSARLGLEVVGLGQQLLDPLGKRRHPEKVSLLLCLDDLSAALGALAIDELTLRPEALAGSAVFAAVLALVDVALVIERLEDFLHALDVIVVGGADVAVVADIHKTPETLENLGDLVDIFLGRHALFGSLLLDFQAVLVGACQEHHVIALHSSVPRDGVAGDGRVAVSDMRIARGVVDGRGDVEFFFLTHE